jgi:hypothetical protein
MKYVHWAVVVSAVALDFASEVGAQSPHVRLEVFNSFEYSEETGDLWGMEVILARTTVGACVSYRDAEGAPGLQQIVPAEIRGDSLFFTIPPDSGFEFHGVRGVSDSTWTEATPASHFRARIRADGLWVQIDGQQQDSGLLPRRRRAYFPVSARTLSNVALQQIKAPRSARCTRKP